MIRNFLHRFCILVSSAAALLVAGCSDSPDDGMGAAGVKESANVAFIISARSQGGATRSDGGTPADPASVNEMINDWWLVFVDSDGVRKIVKRDDVVSPDADGKRLPVEVESFRCIVPPGSYDIYAFANISPDELEAATDLTFVEDDPAPSDLLSKVWMGLGDSDGRKKVESVSQLGLAYDANANSVSDKNLNLWDGSKPVPMSGYKHVEIENTIEETFSIEVVRMVAKVELQFKNPGSVPVTIKAVGFSPVTVTPVPLFPDYDVLGEKAFSARTDAEYARLKHDISGNGIEVPAAIGDVIGTSSYSFFMKESLSHDTGSFTLWLEVEYAEGVTEFLQFSPTVDIRDYINRNDWIRIPVRLSDFDVKVEALFYPPIGGYPAINEGTDPDGSQEFSFGTPGKFAIMPYVTDKMSGSQLPYQRYRIEVDEIRYVPKVDGADAAWKNVDWSEAAVIYSAPTASENSQNADKGIFSVLPVKVEDSSTALPYEILGELNAKQGIARVNLKIYVYEANYTQGAIPKHTFTRHLYIIRENLSTNNNQD